MLEQKHKIGKTSINNQFRPKVSSQNSFVAVKLILKSIIIYKNQQNEPHILFRVVTISKECIVFSMKTTQYINIESAGVIIDLA